MKNRLVYYERPPVRLAEFDERPPVKTMDITAVEFALWLCIALVVGVSMGRVSDRFVPRVQPTAIKVSE